MMRTTWNLSKGLIARRSGQKTTLGAWLDPMADKLLLVTTFVVLTLPGLGFANRLPVWLTVLIISRDKGVLFTDGRYTVQVQQEVDPSFTAVDNTNRKILEDVLPGLPTLSLRRDSAGSLVLARFMLESPQRPEGGRDLNDPAVNNAGRWCDRGRLVP